jgi:DNA-directed RNA polymerase specialized sigma24 family protein/ribosome-associated translation inhibitor RaiA
MRTQWVFNHCEAEKRRARSYWASKAHRWERLLKNSRSGRPSLKMSLDHHRSRDQWELRAVLNLPTGTLVAEQSSDTIPEVIDKAADELVDQIRRHKELVRKNYLSRRRRRRRERISTASPYLERDVASDRRAAFFQLLRPLLKMIEEQARHELKLLEIEQVIPVAEASPAELADDVLVRAWEQFDKRPTTKPLEMWLIGLLHQRLDELREQVPPLTLAAPVIRQPAPRDSDFDDIRYWLADRLEERETTPLEQSVADAALSDIWERLSAHEQYEQAMQLLAKLPKHQRQSLMLREVYGFEVKEIAMTLNRSDQQVTADIDSARETVRKALLAPNDESHCPEAPRIG